MFFFVAGHRRWGKWRGEETVADLPCRLSFLQQRMNPRAASSGREWRRRATTVLVSRNLPSLFLQLQKAFLQFLDYLGFIL